MQNTDSVVIQVSEATAIKKTVSCECGKSYDVWYVWTPEGVILEFAESMHQYLPESREDKAYTEGSCCFRAACETAWTSGLQGLLYQNSSRKK